MPPGVVPPAGYGDPATGAKTPDVVLIMKAEMLLEAWFATKVTRGRDGAASTVISALSPSSLEHALSTTAAEMISRRTLCRVLVCWAKVILAFFKIVGHISSRGVPEKTLDFNGF